MTPSETIKAAEEMIRWYNQDDLGPMPLAYSEQAKMLRSLIALVPKEGEVIVPKEPTQEMSNKGEFVNSEWLNDNAPIGQRRYREPAKAVYKAMIEAFMDDKAEKLAKKVMGRKG